MRGGSWVVIRNLLFLCLVFIVQGCGNPASPANSVGGTPAANAGSQPTTVSSGNNSGSNSSSNGYWASNYPAVAPQSATSFAFQARVQSAAYEGLLYYVVLPDSAATPAAINIQHGLDSSGNSSLPASGSIKLGMNDVSTVTVSGLVAGTLYSICFVPVFTASGAFGTVERLSSIAAGAIAAVNVSLPLEQDWDGVHFYWGSNSTSSDGYVVQRSTAQDFSRDVSSYKIEGNAVLSYTDTAYIPDSINYYRVASYRTINGSQVLSSYSSPASRYCVDTAFESDVTMAFLPDTQFYSQYANLNQVFYTQMQWLANNYSSKNIMFTAGLGDIVNDWDSAPQWKVAVQAYKYLASSNVPYGLVRGNHDSPGSFLANFPPSTWLSASGGKLGYYGGSSANGYNSYFITSSKGQQYLFLCLDYQKDYLDLPWVKSVLAANPHLPTILVMHQLLAITLNTTQPSSIQIMTDPSDNNQQWIADELIKPYPQVFMAVCGHNHGSGYMTITNNAGKNVVLMLCDYQMAYRQGNGWIRLVRFNFANGVMQALSYSPFVAAIPRENRFADGSEDEAFLTSNLGYYSDNEFKVKFDLKAFIASIQ